MNSSGFLLFETLLHLYFSYLCHPMKFPLHVLALYTLLLSCFPCQDNALVGFGQATVTAFMAGADHSPHETPDLCSPFCICTCCAGMDIPVLKTSLPEKPVAEFVGPSASPYTPATPSGGRNSFWQPPRA